VVTISAEGDLGSLATLLRQGIPGATGAQVVDRKVLLEVNGSKGVLPAVVELADRHGHRVSDLSVNEPTLETVFIKLTGKDLRE